MTALLDNKGQGKVGDALSESIQAGARLSSEKSGVARTLSQQIIRSGTSIGANVEEAQGGQSRADFLAKIFIALKEARETLYWLKLLIAAGIVETAKLKELTLEANEIVAILTSIVKSTRENQNI